MKKLLPILLAVVLVFTCIVMVSCGPPSTLPADTPDEFKYEYKLSVAFEDKSDESIFVARLNAIGCEVLSVQENNGLFEYTLKAKELVRYNEFDWLCKNYKLEVFDIYGEELLTRENVLSATGFFIFYAKLSPDASNKVIDKNLKKAVVKLDGEEHIVDINLIEDTLWITQPPDKLNDILLKAIVYFSTNDLNKDVRIESVSLTKRISIG